MMFSRTAASWSVPAIWSFAQASRRSKAAKGRTNQIRIHLWHLGFPILGDAAYLVDGEIGETQTLAVDDPPLFLHALRIAFTHPLTKERVTFEAERPAWARAD